MTFFDAGIGAGVAPRSPNGKSQSSGSQDSGSQDSGSKASGSESSGLERAVLAAGCFWGVEARLLRVDGVVASEVGYTGGETNAPTYGEVCRGDTGHAEVCALAFDRKELDFESLLEVFWTLHDPTQKDRQGYDVGRQYRSAIFVLDETQRRKAEGSRELAQKRLRLPIVTEIASATRFWRAEEYHQRYLEKKRGQVEEAQELARVF